MSKLEQLEHEISELQRQLSEKRREYEAALDELSQGCDETFTQRYAVMSAKKSNPMWELVSWHLTVEEAAAERERLHYANQDVLYTVVRHDDALANTSNHQ